MTCQNQFKLEVDGVSITVAERPQKITSGSVGVFRCAFSFSACWDGLSRTAVFKAHSKTSNSAAMIIREVLLDEEGEAEIPWECLSQKGYTLSAGVYGTNDGTVVMPTVWSELGSVLPGTTAANSGSPPTPSIYDQVLDVAKNAEKIAQDLREDAESGAFNGKPGDPGKPGAPGKDGGYYQPSVSEDGQLAFNPSQEDMPAVPSAYIKGPPGQDAPQIDDSRVSSATPWSSRQIVDTLAPEFEASGAVVTCTPVPGYPLHVVSQIMPVQDGEGDPSPDNVRPIRGWDAANLWVGGENLWKGPPGYTVAENSYYTSYSDDETVAAINSLPRGVPLYFSASWDYSTGGTEVVWLGSVISQNQLQVKNNTEITIPRGVVYDGIRVYAGANKTQDATVTDFTFSAGASTPYPPYNPASKAITLPFGQRVYGGTLDWTTGVLTVTHAQIASYAGELLPGSWISDRDVYSQGATPTTGAQVVYELANPITIQLTPTEILALSGTNTLYTDTGDTTVSGRADPNAIIQQLTQRIAALESAATNL